MTAFSPGDIVSLIADAPRSGFSCKKGTVLRLLQAKPNLVWTQGWDAVDIEGTIVTVRIDEIKLAHPLQALAFQVSE